MDPVVIFNDNNNYCQPWILVITMFCCISNGSMSEGPLHSQTMAKRIYHFHAFIYNYVPVTGEIMHA